MHWRMATGGNLRLSRHVRPRATWAYLISGSTHLSGRMSIAAGGRPRECEFLLAIWTPSDNMKPCSGEFEFIRANDSTREVMDSPGETSGAPSRPRNIVLEREIRFSRGAWAVRFAFPSSWEFTRLRAPAVPRWSSGVRDRGDRWLAVSDQVALPTCARVQ